MAAPSHALSVLQTGDASFFLEGVLPGMQFCGVAFLMLKVTCPPRPGLIFLGTLRSEDGTNGSESEWVRTPWARRSSHAALSTGRTWGHKRTQAATVQTHGFSL